MLVYYGSGDPQADAEVVSSFSEILNGAGVEHDDLEVSGGHCNLDHEPVIQFIAEHLSFEMPQ